MFQLIRHLKGYIRSLKNRHACFVGGNQRELARQKNAKKQSECGKGKRNEDGLSAAARKQRYKLRSSSFSTK